MTLETITKFFIDHFTMLFSGLGVAVIGWIFFNKYSSINKVIQKNISSNGDVIGRDKRG